VADLRLTASRYPADRTLRRLITDLASGSPRFAELWEAVTPPPLTDPSRHKTINHPATGPITLDCDTLFVAPDDLRITVYTAEPGTEDADRLALAIVLGTQVTSALTTNVRGVTRRRACRLAWCSEGG
jgi:hypothetical protein